MHRLVQPLLRPLQRLPHPLHPPVSASFSKPRLSCPVLHFSTGPFSVRNGRIEGIEKLKLKEPIPPPRHVTTRNGDHMSVTYFEHGSALRDLFYKLFYRRYDEYEPKYVFNKGFIPPASMSRVAPSPKTASRIMANHFLGKSLDDLVYGVSTIPPEGTEDNPLFEHYRKCSRTLYLVNPTMVCPKTMIPLSHLLECSRPGDEQRIKQIQTEDETLSTGPIYPNDVLAYKYKSPKYWRDYEPKDWQFSQAIRTFFGGPAICINSNYVHRNFNLLTFVSAHEYYKIAGSGMFGQPHLRPFQQDEAEVLREFILRTFDSFTQDPNLVFSINNVSVDENGLVTEEALWKIVAEYGRYLQR